MQSYDCMSLRLTENYKVFNFKADYSDLVCLTYL